MRPTAGFLWKNRGRVSREVRETVRSDILGEWIDGNRPNAPVTRYELVLAAIPAAFPIASLFASAVSASTRTAVVVGSVVSLLALFDALFRNPPRNPGPVDRQ